MLFHPRTLVRHRQARQRHRTMCRLPLRMTLYLPIGTWSGWSPPTSSSVCAVGYTTSVRQRHLSYSDICPTATSVLQRHLSDSCYQKTTSVQNFDLSDRCRHADCSVDTTSSFYKSSVRFIRALEVCGEPRGLLRSYHW